MISYLGTSGATVFTTLVLMTGITAAIPYAFSALAQLKWRLQDREKVHTPHFALDVGVALVALVFSLRVHLVLPQQRCRLVRRLGTVPDGRRRSAPAASRSTSPSASSMTEPAPVPEYRVKEDQHDDTSMSTPRSAS